MTVKTQALIIFARRPESGKVKTRLSATTLSFPPRCTAFITRSPEQKQTPITVQCSLTGTFCSEAISERLKNL